MLSDHIRANAIALAETLGDLLHEYIDEVLAAKNKIAFIWTTRDVRTLRPDLDEADAWEVLLTFKQEIDDGLNEPYQDKLYAVAATIFGEPPDEDEEDQDA
jgi:hypothetical protein